MNIAVIPARGGSKRIPRKNILPFHGKPMIAWPIGVALDSRLFDAVVVSTEDDEIASVATACGAEVPFRRPAELANDHAPTMSVVRHAVEWWQTNRGTVKYVCCIYATAPFLNAADLERGLRALEADSELEFVFAVTRFPFPIFRALRLDSDGHTSMFWPEHELTRSQDLPEAWHDAGQFYLGTADAWRSRERLFSARSVGVPLPRHRVQDIDTPEDWARAELIFRTLNPTA